VYPFFVSLGGPPFRTPPPRDLLRR
jgi:hypothetical protein